MTAGRKAVMALFAVVSAVYAGCDRTPPSPSRIAQLVIMDGGCGGECRLEVGAVRQFSAIVAFGDGTRPRDLVWSSDKPDVATVDAAGTVRGVRSGVTMIRATAGSLFAMRGVRVVGAPLGPWKGQAVVRSCSGTGHFDQWWCEDIYPVGSRITFELHLGEDNGRLDGGVAIDRSGGGLDVDEGSSIDADGRIQLSARGEGGLGFIGPYLAIIDPLRAQVRGNSLEGNFVMTVIGGPGSGLDGSVVIEADLDGVTIR